MSTWSLVACENMPLYNDYYVSHFIAFQNINDRGLMLMHLLSNLEPITHIHICVCNDAIAKYRLAICENLIVKLFNGVILLDLFWLFLIGV